MSLLKISSGERDSGSFKILHNTLHSWWRVPCSFFLSQSPYQEWTDLVENQVPDFYLFHQWPPLREHGVRQRTRRKTSTARNALRCTSAVPHVCTRLSVHMSSAKIRGKTSAEAGVQRISPSTICQKSFLSVTAEKLRVNSLLIEKNIGFVKSQTPEWSAGPNLYLRRTQYLHALFVYIFLAFLRGSWFKGQNNTLILDGRCP